MGEGETSGTLVWLKIRPQRGMLRNTYHSTESFGDEKGYKEVVIAEAHGSDEAVRCAMARPQSARAIPPAPFRAEPPLFITVLWRLPARHPADLNSPADVLRRFSKKRTGRPLAVVVAAGAFGRIVGRRRGAWLLEQPRRAVPFR